MVIFQNLSYFQKPSFYRLFIYIIYLMGKKTLQSQGIHRFSLKPIFDSCYFRKQIYVDFCFRKINENCCCSQMERNSNYVIFNKDKNYATPSFILNFDQQYYFNFFWALKREHDEKLMTMENSQQPIEFPNPQSQKKKCHVCSCIYSDYFQHIESKTHKKKVEKSTFNNDILELQKAFLKTNKLNEIQIQKKNQITTYSQQDQNSLQLRQNNIKSKRVSKSRKENKIKKQLKRQPFQNGSSEQEQSKINDHNQNIFQTQQFNRMIINLSQGFRKGPLQCQNAHQFYKFQQDLLSNPFLTNFQKYHFLQYLNLQNVNLTNSWIKFFQANTNKEAIQNTTKGCQTNNPHFQIFPIQNEPNKEIVEKISKIQTQNQNQEQNQQKRLKMLVKNMKQTNQKLRKINAQQAKKLKILQKKGKRVKKEMEPISQYK